MLIAYAHEIDIIGRTVRVETAVFSKIEKLAKMGLAALVLPNKDKRQNMDPLVKYFIFVVNDFL